MKFNFSLKGRQPAGTHYTFIKAGVPDAQWELYTALLNFSLNPSNDSLLSIRTTIRRSDPELIASLALYFREQNNFSRLAFLLSAELAILQGNDERIGALVARIVRQVSDLPAWLEYFQAAKTGQKPGRAAQPGRAIRKQLNTLFSQLDEYQFSRYSKHLQTGLKQAILSLQPRAVNREQKALFVKILKEQFPVRSTWEQEWHALHQHHYDGHEQRQVILRDKWKEGISTFRIGYTALLDNLQPMLCTGVSGKVLKLAAEYLGNAAAASRANHSPLRMLEVYRSLRDMDQGGAVLLIDALEQAVYHSSWARSGFGKNAVSVIAMDISDSMKRPVGGPGSALRFDIAPLLALLWKSRGDQVITGFIGNTWKPLDISGQPPIVPSEQGAHVRQYTYSVLATTDELRLREGEAGYATNAHLILQSLLRRGQIVDKILVFTDSRLWDRRSFNQSADSDLHGAWKAYKQMAPQAKLYLFDLAGYGDKSLECPEEDVFLISGWQDRIFDVLQAHEEGKKSFEPLHNMR
ncbi:MAG: TROVE domain-containing protein [Bacteroidetes bacterium]|nr:TROVE domain-containing protein [Bacteroidota bacterium]